MKVKAHYSNGEWRVCRAEKGNCPYGGDNEHKMFSSKAEMKNLNSEKMLEESKKDGSILPKAHGYSKQELELQEKEIEKVLTDIQDDYITLCSEYESALEGLENVYNFDCNSEAHNVLATAIGIETLINKEATVGTVDFPEVDEGNYELNPETSEIDRDAYNTDLEYLEDAKGWEIELVDGINRDVALIKGLDWKERGFNTQKEGVDVALSNLYDYYEY